MAGLEQVVVSPELVQLITGADRGLGYRALLATSRDEDHELHGATI